MERTHSFLLNPTPIASLADACGKSSLPIHSLKTRRLEVVTRGWTAWFATTVGALAKYKIHYPTFSPTACVESPAFQYVCYVVLLRAFLRAYVTSMMPG